LGGWPLIIWEATTAKRNYYRANEKFGGLGKIWGPVPTGPNVEPPLAGA